MHTSSRFKFASFAMSALAAVAPLRAQGPTVTGDRVVMLPPFVVQGVTWRYAHPPGFEVLSRWSDSRTEAFANAALTAGQMFDAVLPPDFQAKLSVPTVYLLVPDNGNDALSAPLMAQLLAHSPGAGAGSGQQPKVLFLPNLLLWDRDTLAVFFVQPGRSIDVTRMVYSDDRVRLALERRVPALPRWFIDGFCDLYRGMQFSRGAAETGMARWVSQDQSAKLAADPDSPRQLLPLAEVFADPADGSTETQAHADLRLAETSLFIRWSLDGENHPRRAALWKLVDDASAGPVTEQHFADLFGEDYFWALNDLSDYLPWALTHSLPISPPLAPADSDIKLRDATPAEVGRIKGDWERLEMDQVALQHPELKPRYLEHAQETFNLAHQDDKTDPGLLGAMGLFELDCGKPALADPLLRAAAAGHVVRPRVYYELVRLLFNELISAQSGASKAQAQLSPIQAATLLGLLDQARKQSPPLPEVYGLYSQIALAAGANPTPAVMQVCREGARLFPGDPALLYDAAIALASGGDLASARDILKKGLATRSDPQLRTRMAGLQGRLEVALRAQGAN
ncbi:MAG: hypothetical protein ABSA05_08330 [Opitutaceae bacterium]